MEDETKRDSMKELIQEYYKIMREIDPTFHWSNSNWWADSSSAKVIPASGGLGFAIVGYGSHVDSDVNSEICELYCKSPLVLLSLIRSTIPHLRWPFGFQVLQSNVHAQLCFEKIAARMQYEVSKYAAVDGESHVYKYRVKPQNNNH